MKRSHEETDVPPPPLTEEVLTRADTWHYTFDILRQSTYPGTFIQTIAAVAQTCRSLRDVVQCYPPWVAIRTVHALVIADPALLAEISDTNVHGKQVVFRNSLYSLQAMADVNILSERVHVTWVHRDCGEVGFRVVGIKRAFSACTVDDTTHIRAGGFDLDNRAEANLLSHLPGWTMDTLSRAFVCFLRDW